MRTARGRRIARKERRSATRASEAARVVAGTLAEIRKLIGPAGVPRAAAERPEKPKPKKRTAKKDGAARIETNKLKDMVRKRDLIISAQNDKISKYEALNDSLAASVANLKKELKDLRSKK